MCEIITGVINVDMEEKLDSFYCFGCICDKNERKLQYYNFRCDLIKEIFKTSHILLCYLCKRMLQKAELFLQNVQSNQILLENFKNVMDDTLKLVRLQINPIVNLKQVSYNAIDLSGKDGDCTEEGNFSVMCNSNQEVKVKIEMKEETEFMDSDDFINGNDDFPDMYVKEEDLPLDELVKEEIGDNHINNLDNEHLDSFNLSLQEKPEKKATSIVTMVYISEEQCTEERLQMAKDPKYIDCLYKCVDCIKGFTRKGCFDMHMEKHNQCMGDHVCDICKQRMDSKEKLVNHMRYHKVRYKCMECGLIRKCKESIINHYSSDHLGSNQQYICTKCLKIFPKSRLLRNHIARVHVTKERVQCAYCSRTYCNKNVLSSHILLKHTKEISLAEVTKKYMCPECGRSFNSPSQLKTHSLKHSDSRNFYCVECDKRFKSEYSLKYHLKNAAIHVDYKKLPLGCLYCDKRFSTQRDLTRHMNRIHLNVRPFACDKCDKTYVNLWGLKEHQRFIHDGHKRPLQYPCPMCDKVFTRNQILKSHIRTHTGERPYQCKQCPATFNQASTLRTHDRLIHHKLTRSGKSKNTVQK